MPRSRNIKPAFFKDDELHEHGPLAALLFSGLWTIADKAGRLKDRPAWIKAECLPYYECDADELLGKLASGPDPFIVRYVVDSLAYIQIRSWEKHQSPHHKEDSSKIPSMKHASESGLSNQDSGINNQVSGIRAASTGLGCPTMDRRQPKHDPSTGQASAKADSREFNPYSVELPFDSDTFRASWSEWIQHRIEIKKPLTPTSVKKQLAKLSSMGETVAIAAIAHTVANGWVGIREPDDARRRGNASEGRLQRSIAAGQRFLESGGGK